MMMVNASLPEFCRDADNGNAYCPIFSFFAMVVDIRRRHLLFLVKQTRVMNIDMFLKLKTL